MVCFSLVVESAALTAHRANDSCKRVGTRSRGRLVPQFRVHPSKIDDRVRSSPLHLNRVGECRARGGEPAENATMMKPWRCNIISKRFELSPSTSYRGITLGILFESFTALLLRRCGRVSWIPDYNQRPRIAFDSVLLISRPNYFV
jgi:hypothetical protein